MANMRDLFAVLNFPFYAHKVSLQSSISSAPASAPEEKINPAEALRKGIDTVLTNPLDAITHLEEAKLGFKKNGLVTTLTYLALAHQRLVPFHSQRNEFKETFSHHSKALDYCEQACKAADTLSEEDKEHSNITRLLQKACIAYVRAQIALSSQNNDFALQNAITYYEDALKNIEEAGAIDYKHHYIILKLQQLKLLCRQHEHRIKNKVTENREDLKQLSDVFHDLEHKYFLHTYSAEESEFVDYLFTTLGLTHKKDDKYGGAYALDFFEMFGDYFSTFDSYQNAISRYEIALRIASPLGDSDRVSTLENKIVDAKKALAESLNKKTDKPVQTTIASTKKPSPPQPCSGEQNGKHSPSTLFSIEVIMNNQASILSQINSVPSTSPSLSGSNES